MQPEHAISHCGEDARRKVRQKYGARLNYYVYKPRERLFRRIIDEQEFPALERERLISQTL
jgi:hypothetical protein